MKEIIWKSTNRNNPWAIKSEVTLGDSNLKLVYKSNSSLYNVNSEVQIVDTDGVRCGVKNGVILSVNYSDYMRMFKSYEGMVFAFEFRIQDIYYKSIFTYDCFSRMDIYDILENNGVFDFLRDESRASHYKKHLIINDSSLVLTKIKMADSTYEVLVSLNDKFYQINFSSLDNIEREFSDNIYYILKNNKKTIMEEKVIKNSVTQEDVDNVIAGVKVTTLDDFGKPTTYVAVVLKNGFTMREATTCVDPDNYNEKIGAEICMKKIKDKIWFLLGYQLQEEIYRSQNIDDEDGGSVIDSAYQENKTENTNIPDFVQRMLNERYELKDRMDKLETFIASGSPHYMNLPDFVQGWMQEQSKYMKGYYESLCNRLDYFLDNLAVASKEN